MVYLKLAAILLRKHIQLRQDNCLLLKMLNYIDFTRQALLPAQPQDRSEILVFSVPLSLLVPYCIYLFKNVF